MSLFTPNSSSIENSIEKNIGSIEYSIEIRKNVISIEYSIEIVSAIVIFSNIFGVIGQRLL